MQLSLMARLEERRLQLWQSDEESDSFWRLSELEPSLWRELLAGNRVLTATQFDRICRALVVDPGAMFRGEPVDADLAPARFRGMSEGTLTNADDMRLLLLAAQVGRTLGHLANSLDRAFPVLKHRRPVGLHLRLQPWKQGYDLAARFGDLLNRGESPLLDFAAWMRGIGVHVVPVEFATSDIKGVTVAGNDSLPVVLVNMAHRGMSNPGVLRSTLAHELAHVLFDAGDKGYTSEVTRATVGRASGLERTEQRANAFAPAILAPANVFKLSVLGTGAPLDELGTWQRTAAHWGLSFEGAVSHGKNAVGLSESLFLQLVAARPRPRVSLDRFEPSLYGEFRSVSQRLSAKRLSHDQRFWQGLAGTLLADAVHAGVMAASRRVELAGAE